MSDRVMTDAIRKALEARFCAPEWASFFEVAERTGGGCRSADCVAMNLYPSRGLRVHGVEIKASRSDWMRELREPEKAEPVMRYCDHWWIAARPGIVLDGELPPTWGLLELHGGTLRQKVAAPKLEAVPLERAFAAALLRRAAGKAQAELRKAVDEKLVAERARIRDEVDRAVQNRTREYSDLRAAVDEFEAASGLTIQRYGDMKGMGEAVKMLRDAGVVQTWNGIRSIAKSARAFADKVDEILPAAASDDTE